MSLKRLVFQPSATKAVACSVIAFSASATDPNKLSPETKAWFERIIVTGLVLSAYYGLFSIRPSRGKVRSTLGGAIGTIAVALLGLVGKAVLEDLFYSVA